MRRALLVAVLLLAGCTLHPHVEHDDREDPTTTTTDQPVACLAIGCPTI